MITVRRATVADAAELVRLRGILLGIPEDSNENGWREASHRILARRLAEPSPTMAAFVIDQPAALPAQPGSSDNPPVAHNPRPGPSDRPSTANNPEAGPDANPSTARGLRPDTGDSHPTASSPQTDFSATGSPLLFSGASRSAAVDGLAACAVGILEERLGGPRNPDGMFGYMLNVATDPAYRRLGYARACTAALLEWFAAEGAHTVDLRASAAAEPLYTSQGFVRTKDPAMRLTRPHA